MDILPNWVLNQLSILRIPGFQWAEDTIISIKRKRNSRVAWACRLPPEVVIQILTCAQLEAYRDPYDASQPLADLFEEQHIFPTGGYKHDWMRLMGSCSYWREVALAARELWRYVKVPGNDHWRALCRSRSQGLPPYVFARDTPLTSEAYVKVMRTSFLRASKAYVCQDSSSMWDTFDQPYPQLKFLSFESQTINLSQNFLGGESSNLTTLVLMIHLVNSLPNLPNLRNLKIDFHSYNMRNRLSGVSHGDPLMKWLNCTPSIEVLSITIPDNVPFLYSTDALDLFTIYPAVPALCILELKCTPLVCLNLMKIFSPKVKSGLNIEMNANNDIYRDDWNQHIKARLLEASDHLINLISTFWRRHSPTQHLPSLQALGTNAVGTGPTYGDLYLYMGSVKHQCPLDITQPFYRLKAPVAIFSGLGVLDLATTLHFPRSNPHDLWAALVRDWRCLEGMVNLKTIFIDQPSSVKHMHKLGEWIVDRHKRGRPIRLIQIENPENVAVRECLQELTNQWRHHRIIQEVKWSASASASIS